MQTSLDVSVVIPYFNASETIIAAIKSVYEQTVDVREVIVVDDGSDMYPAEDILRFYLPHFTTLRIITLAANGGAGNARNAGVRLAGGKFIAFLDADDIWLPTKLETQLSYMLASGASLSAHGYQEKLAVGPGSISRVSSGSYLVSEIGTTQMLLGSRFATPTVVVSNDGDVHFDEQLRRSEDYCCWFQLMKRRGVTCHFIELKMAAGHKYAIGVSGLSASIQDMHIGYLEALALLLHSGVMNPLEFLIALLIEKLKLPIRMLRVKLRQWKG